MRQLLVLVLVAMLGCVGCSGFQEHIPNAVVEGVVLVDELATENEAIVERLVIDRANVTEDEEVIAIRNARALKILTKVLRKGVE